MNATRSCLGIGVVDMWEDAGPMDALRWDNFVFLLWDDTINMDW